MRILHIFPLTLSLYIIFLFPPTSSYKETVFKLTWNVFTFSLTTQNNIYTAYKHFERWWLWQAFTKLKEEGAKKKVWVKWMKNTFHNCNNKICPFSCVCWKVFFFKYLYFHKPSLCFPSSLLMPFAVYKAN